MTEPTEPPANAWKTGVLVLAVLLLSGLALIAPLGEADVPARVGVLLMASGIAEVMHGFRRSVAASQRQAWGHGLVSLILGVVLINAPLLAGSALLLLLAVSLLGEGWGLLFGSRRSDGTDLPNTRRVAGVGYILAAAALLFLGHRMPSWAIAVAGALRILRAAGGIARAPVFGAHDADATVIADIGLPDDPAVLTRAAEISQQERDRVSIDRGWVIGFIVTLFAIHVARMGFDRSFLGIFSPGFAVLGDVFVALVIAYAIVIPGGILWRRATLRYELRAWQWTLADAQNTGLLHRLLNRALTHRLRARMRIRQTRYSLRTAMGRGLQIGLPAAAVIAATTPIWGMSWYFDTENWAAGVWNSWAEQRTDTWREAMGEAALARVPNRPPDQAFAVHPPGIEGDFSFIVIGDPGEGDASQQVLRAALLSAVGQDDVKFVVISSDVVYPTGAMRDYEAKFWIQFMGITKPVYAIPGNHDWYDALEGFNATFLRPDAARSAMRARIETDRRISSTNDAAIERLIDRASRLRDFYGVPTQQQELPYFQVQTDSFALFAIDTGVARRIDPVQMKWLRAALEAARGKMKMAILGHPFIAGGRSTIGDNQDFAELYELLREHNVMLVMAGDTHDLEYYMPDPPTDPPTSRPAMHHFVNGGGGAYLSFGTALDWPTDPAAPVWAYYPSRRDVVAKIRATTPWWKRPVWWWTNRFGAWPASAEFLSAAFDVNAAPFYQSFVVVRVEPSRRQIRIIPHGVHGRLRWSDFDRGGIDQEPSESVEWTITDPSSTDLSELPTPTPRP